MSLRSPKSPTDFSRRGFQPLSTPAEHRMNPEYGIPLAPIKSNNSTGARRPGDGIMPNDPTKSHTLRPENEKSGGFSAGRRKAKKLNSRVATDGEEVSVNGLGRFYKKIVEASVVFRYLVYVAPVALVLAAPIVALAILKPNTTMGGMRLYLFFTWLEVVWLSIWVSKLLAKLIPWIFMFLCGVVSSGTRKYAMILRAVEIPLSLLGWAATNLVTFTALTNRSLNTTPSSNGPTRWTEVMTRLLGPILIGCALLLIEKLIIQLISVSYHRRSFQHRIKESKHLIHLLGLLFDASRTLFPMYCLEFREEDYAINDSIEAILEKSGYRHKKSGSATPMRLIGEVGRIGDKVTSAFGNIASEITGKQVFNPTSAHSIVIEALEKKRSSEALAKRLWMSFVVEGKEALYAEDIEEVLGSGRNDEAQETFAVLDSDGNGDISLDEMIMKVVETGQERKDIANSMRDVGQAIGVLDSVMVFILSIVVIFIFVAFQNTNFVTTLATAGTALLSLSFVFAGTTQEFLGSCIFLFVKHPYDVGDRVDIVGPEKECLVVEQISLLYTVFKRIDNMKMVQVPNITLSTLWIENVTRSKANKEQLEMFISFDTTLEDIEILRQEMEAFVRYPENSRDFQPDLIIEASGIGKMDALALKVEIRHKSNWHNETVRAARRSKFMCALVLALRKVPIYAPGGGGDPLGHPNNPQYSVAVPDEYAVDARSKAKDEKEGKRLVPTPPQEGDDGDSKTTAIEPERKAAEQLNTRAPTDLMGGHTGYSLRDDATTLADERRESLDLQQRNEDLNSLREGLLKRESTRGRRRPGEAIPPLPTIDSGLDVRLTGASTHSHTHHHGFRSHMADVLDEEAEVGIHHSHSHSNTARDSDGRHNNPVNAASPVQGPQAGDTMGGVPMYVFPPTTPESAAGAGTGRYGGGVPAPDYLSASGSQAGRLNTEMASNEGQSRLRGLSLVASNESATSRPRPPVPGGATIPRKPFGPS